MRRLKLALAALAMSVSWPLAAESPPDNWDGLVKVKPKKVDLVFLLPHADFRGYTKIQYDPVEIALQKDWLRDYNRSTMQLSNRISDSDARATLTKAQAKFDQIFEKEFTKAGLPIVTGPGPDVLRVSTAVVNVTVSAPDPINSFGLSFSAEAGQATLVLEVRDSLTNQLLGRAIDAELAGDMPGVRTSVGNWGDFEDLFRQWAKATVQGINELKTLSPVDTNGLQKR